MAKIKWDNWIGCTKVKGTLYQMPIESVSEVPL